MEIRVAEYKDYERIAQLHADSWKIYYRGILADQYLDQDVLEDRSVIWQTRLINLLLTNTFYFLKKVGCLLGLYVHSEITTSTVVLLLMHCMLITPTVVVGLANACYQSSQRDLSNTMLIVAST